MSHRRLRPIAVEHGGTKREKVHACMCVCVCVCNGIFWGEGEPRQIELRCGEFYASSGNVNDCVAGEACVSVWRIFGVSRGRAVVRPRSERYTLCRPARSNLVQRGVWVVVVVGGARSFPRVQRAASAGGNDNSFGNWLWRMTSSPR